MDIDQPLFHESCTFLGKWSAKLLEMTLLYQKKKKLLEMTQEFSKFELGFVMDYVPNH